MRPFTQGTLAARTLCRLWIVGMLTFGASGSLQAGMVSVAVASNFTAPMEKIAAAFEAKTGHQARLSFGSSGKFVAQIQYGAPYDLFLSADTHKPDKLIQLGKAVADQRFTYAQGRLLLISTNPDILDPEAALKTGQFNRLAVANPKLAPYGHAALEVLQAWGLSNPGNARLVRGENITQAWQFVLTGNADLGFVAKAQWTAHSQIEGSINDLPAHPHGTDVRISEIPPNLHGPIKQDVILLKRGQQNPAAVALLEFLQGEEARALIRSYGYDL
jgi:molybdate transport system substrate-binding protein